MVYRKGSNASFGNVELDVGMGGEVVDHPRIHFFRDLILESFTCRHLDKNIAVKQKRAVGANPSPNRLCGYGFSMGW